MYKSRFYLWIGVLLIATFINAILNINFDEIIVKNKDVTINVDTNTFFKSDFLKCKMKQINFIQTTENPIVYIKENSKEQINDYEKIKNAIFSPIILYAPVDIELSSDIFYELSNSTNFVSFKTLADAIIKDKSLSDFGIKDKALKDKKIILNIPAKDSFYYDAVVEQFYIALNNNKIPTQEERQKLKPTIDELLSKCVTCNDVVKKIEELEDNTYNIFIAPEFIIDTDSNFGYNTGYGYYDCVHFEKSNTISYDIFVKNNSMLGNEKLIDIINENILNNENFVEAINHRTKYPHNYSNCFNGSQENNLNIYFSN